VVCIRPRFTLPEENYLKKLQRLIVEAASQQKQPMVSKEVYFAKAEKICTLTKPYLTCLLSKP
jgi:hypothetical protein